MKMSKLIKSTQGTVKIICLGALFILPCLVSGYTRNELLPDATGILAFNNIAKFKKAVTASCVGKLFHDKQLQKRLKNKTFFKLLLSSGDDSKAIKELTEQQLELVSGEFYLLIKYLDMKEDKIAALAVYEITEEQFIKSSEIDKKIHTLKKDKSFYDSYTFQGVTINRTSYTADGEKNIDYSAFIKGTAVESHNNQAWIEKIVSRLLEELPEQQPATAVPYAKITINGQDLLLLIEHNLQEDDNKELIDNILDALGLKSFKSATLTIFPTPVAFEIAIDVIGLDSELGIMTLMDTTPLPASQQQLYVPTNTFNYSVTRLNLKKMCDNATPVINTIKPDLLKQIKAGLMTAEGMLGFNIYDKLIVPLGSIYTNYAYSRNGRQGNASVFSLSDPKTLQQALNQIATKFPYLKHETFLDQTLYTLPGRANRANMSNGASSDNAKKYGMTIVDSSISIGTIDTIHSILRRLNSQQKTALSFYQTDFFKRMHAYVPDNAFSYTFYKLDKMLEIIADNQSGNRGYNKLMRLLLTKLGKDDGKNIDLEHIASFFSNAVIYATNTNGTIEFNLKIFNKQ
jgi:hypothetical protein